MSFYEFNEFEIPDYMGAGIKNYINHGRKPGDFLTAVIQNKLIQAIQTADSTNIKNLQAYAMYFYWEVPSIAWGSEEKMKAWIDRNGLEGEIK